MKKTNFSIKYTLYFLFFEENNKRIVTCFLSSNNHGGIIRSSFFLLKSFILFSIIYFGKQLTCSSDSSAFLNKSRNVNMSTIEHLILDNGFRYFAATFGAL